MKKIYLLLGVVAFLAVPFLVSGQNMVVNGDLEQWEDNGKPTGWDLAQNVSQESTIVHSGTYSAAQESGDNTKKFRQDISNVIPGAIYTISYWYYDNDNNARTRPWCYWMDSEMNYLDDNADVLRPNVFSEDKDEWQQYSVILTAPANAAYFRFDVRGYNQDGNYGGKVYYDDFYFGAQETNDPEPSNYPADFMGEDQGSSAHLTWTDAVGDQLPVGYLIIAAKNQADLFMPTDGTPVMNDDDWSDGVASHNVAYGVQEDSFDDLESDVTYYFVIYPYSNSGDNIDFKTDGTAPSTSVTIPNIVPLDCNDFEDGNFGNWTAMNVSGAQEWKISTYNENTFAKMTGYESGAHANEDWLISPPFNLSNVLATHFEFINAMNYSGNPLQLLVSTDYNGSGDPNNYTWDDISDQVDWSPGNWTWVKAAISLDDYIGKTIYLGFKYTSTDQECATWELDDLCFDVIMSESIGETKYESIKVYPNPARDNFSLNSNETGMLKIFDLTGKVVKTVHVNQGLNNVNVSDLNKGVYIMNLQLIGGVQKTEKLIIK
jgi:hypothetical protein